MQPARPQRHLVCRCPIQKPVILRVNMYVLRIPISHFPALVLLLDPNFLYIVITEQKNTSPCQKNVNFCARFPQQIDHEILNNESNDVFSFQVSGDRCWVEGPPVGGNSSEMR
jgi:hypothetical protein